MDRSAEIIDKAAQDINSKNQSSNQPAASEKKDAKDTGEKKDAKKNDDQSQLFTGHRGALYHGGAGSFSIAAWVELPPAGAGARVAILRLDRGFEIPGWKPRAGIEGALFVSWLLPVVTVSIIILVQTFSFINGWETFLWWGGCLPLGLHRRACHCTDHLPHSSLQERRTS